MARISPKIALISLISACMALAASAEICRSVSGSWDEGQWSYRTQMWTSGLNGCKKIEHSVTYGGVERKIEGYDCDCDLKADGEEAVIKGNPHPRVALTLQNVCQGPMADEPDTADNPGMSSPTRSDLSS